MTKEDLFDTPEQAAEHREMVARRSKDINRVTVVGMAVNLLLSVGKILAGIFGCSAAMISDGIHSVSDFASDIVVLIFVRLSSKARDVDHNFGHGKYETFASLLVVVLLVAVGAKLLAGGVNGVHEAYHGRLTEMPHWIALAAAVVSIVGKEWLYQYTVRVGRRHDSPVVIANAWHHRSDALSSIGAFVGIGGAMLLGGRWLLLDPLVCCVISVILIVEAVKMAIPVMQQLLDFSLPEEMKREMGTIAEGVAGVIDMHSIKTMRNGPSIIIEAHLTVRSDMTVLEAHDICNEVERMITERFGAETQLSLHVEPYCNS